LNGAVRQLRYFRLITHQIAGNTKENAMVSSRIKSPHIEVPMVAKIRKSGSAGDFVEREMPVAARYPAQHWNRDADKAVAFAVLPLCRFEEPS
jgi:hypothetical protein